MNIGIAENSKLVYEATSMHGHPLWPSPVMLQVSIASEEDAEYKAPKPNDLAPHSFIFREDTYNSSSRIRRGRLYRAGGSQPTQWHVYPHPVFPDEARQAYNNGGTLKRQVYSFSSFRLRPYLKANKLHHPIFILGAEDGFTIWSLVNIETNAVGDEMVILRSRKSIGAIPKLDTAKILAADGQSVIDLIEKLEDELFRAGPESIVDRSREAATAILSKYLQSMGKADSGKELGKLANKILNEGFEVVCNSSRIIARFHARGKNAEQEKSNPRYITEQDAEFSVQAIGTILCDLDWAHW